METTKWFCPSCYNLNEILSIEYDNSLHLCGQCGQAVTFHQMKSLAQLYNDLHAINLSSHPDAYPDIEWVAVCNNDLLAAGNDLVKVDRLKLGFGDGPRSAVLNLHRAKWIQWEINNT